MAPTLYMFHGSPPVRAVLMTAKAIDLQLDIKEIDFLNREQLKPHFLKMNPQHTVPTLVDDDGFTIWDSHAIMVYLVAKYAQNDSLYPKDLKKRAIIDQRLHFESGVVFATLRNIAKPIIFDGATTTVKQKDKDAVVQMYEFLESFLDGKEWVAGDAISIADFSLVSSISSLNVLISIPQKCPNLMAWLKRCESLPECEVNKRGVKEFAGLLRSKISKK